MSDTPEPESLARYVELQASAPCRKCKAKDWTLLPGHRVARAGDRVGVYLVLGSPTDRVSAVTFECRKCRATFERPVYTKEQLARQDPSVRVDIRLDGESS